MTTLLEFEFDNVKRGNTRRAAQIVGVVGSGQLEVLIEPAELDGKCEIVVETSAQGFEEIWRSVLADFAAQYPVADLRSSINDGGATPAVVNLRLQQAIAEVLDV